MRDIPHRSRRDVLRGTATLAALGSVAGCTQPTDEGETPTGSGSADAETATPAESSTATDSPTPSGYSVSIEPMGEVEFDGVPETWVANNGSWADMGVALGREPPAAVYKPGRYHTGYYDDIPDVSVDGSEIQQLWSDSGVGREQFHAHGADVHVVDPNFLLNRADWDQSDVDVIREQVGPFFGNSVFSRGYSWHQDYRYYSLYDAFEKLADVFQERERYEAMESVHERFQEDLAPVVPGRSERPSGAVVWGGGDEPETFYPYVIDEGTSFKHLRDLKVRDALAATDVKDFHSSRGAIDFETLTKIDPETLLIRGQEAKSAAAFRDTVVSYFENHSVASELTAVQNGDVYQAGPLYQGPITNLVVTERLAQGLYDHDEALFDREDVADVVTGDV